MADRGQVEASEFLVDARSVTKVQGVPFTAGELEVALLKEMDQ